MRLNNLRLLKVAHPIRLFLALCSLAILVALAIYLAKASQMQSQTHASVSDDKAEFLKAHLKKGIRHTHKLRGPLKVNLDFSAQDMLQAGDVFTLSATLDSKESLNEVHFEWIIPEGLEMISGEQNGSLRLEANESRSLEIVLRKIADENTQVHFKAISQKGAMTFSESAQFNTQDHWALLEDQKRLAETSAQEDPKHRH